MSEAVTDGEQGRLPPDPVKTQISEASRPDMHG